MEFGLEYGNSTFKITFNISSDSNPTQPFISHKFISQQLTSDISTQTGFYTDASGNLYFDNSKGSGLTIGPLLNYSV